MDLFEFQSETLFDSNRLHTITEGDQEFATELLNAAIQSMKSSYENIKSIELSDSKDIPFAQARDLFHALKSSSLNIGCNRLGKCAESLEFCSKTEDSYNFKLLFPLFHLQYQETLSFLKNHF